jgi:F-type H+-transporting ATPase subunit a
MQIIIIKNPLEQFEILDLFSISTSLLGYRFVLTNLGLYIIIITVLSCCISIWITSEKQRSCLLHSYGSILSESIYATILGMVKNQIGVSNERYLPIIFTLFIFILFNNLIGMVPYSFTPTSHLTLTILFFFKKLFC